MSLVLFSCNEAALCEQNGGSSRYMLEPGRAQLDAAVPATDDDYNIG